jgi:hypothetical protein
LRRIAERLRAQGYEVTISPAPELLPRWLRNFRPDLLAVRGAEGLVVEVKSREEMRGDSQLQRLAEVVEARPGWRFELEVSNPRVVTDEPAQVRAAEARIEDQLQAAVRLLEADLREPALLNSWAAFEGAARILLEDEGTGAPVPTRQLLRTLWSFGYLEPETRDRLERLANARNLVAHGGEAPELSKADTDALDELTRDLLVVDRPLTEIPAQAGRDE